MFLWHIIKKHTTHIIILIFLTINIFTVLAIIFYYNQSNIYFKKQLEKILKYKILKKDCYTNKNCFYVLKQKDKITFMPDINLPNKLKHLLRNFTTVDELNNKKNKEHFFRFKKNMDIIYTNHKPVPLDIDKIKHHDFGLKSTYKCFMNVYIESNEIEILNQLYRFYQNFIFSLIKDCEKIAFCFVFFEKNVFMIFYIKDDINVELYTQFDVTSITSLYKDLKLNRIDIIYYIQKKFTELILRKHK